jgi:regulatory protein
MKHAAKDAKGKAAGDRARRRRGPRKATPDYLHRAALHYLERYQSSAENLRRVLLRKVQRSAIAHGTDAEDGAAEVDRLIARFESAGLLDDAAYAEARTASLHRRGASRRAIAMKLRQKGVDADTIEGALDDLAELEPEPELAAAVTYAKRRRLGPWRADGRAEAREKDLAALARQGFGYDTARRVIEADDAEELEIELATARGRFTG